MSQRPRADARRTRYVWRAGARDVPCPACGAPQPVAFRPPLWRPVILPHDACAGSESSQRLRELLRDVLAAIRAAPPVE